MESRVLIPVMICAQQQAAAAPQHRLGSQR